MKHGETSRRIGVFSGVLGLGLLACAIRIDPTRPAIDPWRWWDERGPVVPHESFPTDCELCHVGSTWHEIRDDFAFDHHSETGVALEGAHVGAECLRCHNDRGPVELFASRGCAGCHEDIHRAQLGSNCEDCHDSDDWRPTGQFELHARTRFPLFGAHAATACFRCHEGAQVGEFTRTDVECISCHTDDLAVALDPDHLAQGWVDRCDRCHIPTSWAGAGFNHSTFPLTGAHASADCSDCHAGGVFAGTPSACVACHQAEYDATTDPNHMAAGFPTTCQSCHGTTTWFGAVFNHSFPITSGPHQVLDCSDCHVNPSSFAVFSCLTCHEHNQTDTDDDHDEVSGYVYNSPDCYACHPDGQE